MKCLYYMVFSFLILFFCISCNTAVSSNGGGSETTNSFTACIHDTIITGKGFPGYSVQCYDTGYKPYVDSVFKHTTIYKHTTIIEDGSYFIVINKPGVYNLFSISSDSSALLHSAAITSVSIATGEDTIYKKEYSEPGSIKFLQPTDTSWKKKTSVFVLYLIGTSYYKRFNVSTQFPIIISKIPESEYVAKFAAIEMFTAIDTNFIEKPKMETIKFSDKVIVNKNSEKVVQFK